jgi:hypothetical protein
MAYPLPDVSVAICVRYLDSRVFDLFLFSFGAFEQ